MSDHPSWIKVHAPTPAEAQGIREVRQVLKKHHLTTVCQGAICPNAVACWSERTATFMILGDTCTRGCRFCAVPTGDPGGTEDLGEAERLAGAVSELGLRYVVLTSVDRDDLPDRGAGSFVRTVEAIKRHQPDVLVEVLLPDMSGDPRLLGRVLAADIAVWGHNVETVRRLTPILRDVRAGFDQSLEVLAFLSGEGNRRVTKSGMMLGLGETRDEIRETLRCLRDARVNIVTLGQYLRPTRQAAPVVRYLPPEEFDDIADEARAMGFEAVVAGPLVRSSFHAEQAYHTCVS